MLSIFAPHFFNWTEQLKDSDHEVYWLDIFDSDTKVDKIDFVQQIIGWRYKWNYPGRYYLKKNVPILTNVINKFNERNLEKELNKQLQKIQPDVVHSFVMYLATAPVLDVMKKHQHIKWIYSSWGSDLFFYRNKEKELRGIKDTFPELDYMFADCHRDYKIAVENGFSGKFLGVFPGGGGFDIEATDVLMQPTESRKLILIKGYQGLHGRCISVLTALTKNEEQLKPYELVIFGTSEEVQQYVNQSSLERWENLKVLGQISHLEVMKLMGKALIYIGNSLSDGTPNTLLEAIVMGAFPVQSNPGGATAEMIQHGKNGYLIQDPEDVDEIKEILKNALSRKEIIFNGINYNLEKIKPGLERTKVKNQVLSKYAYIEENLKQKKA